LKSSRHDLAVSLLSPALFNDTLGLVYQRIHYESDRLSLSV
jgi:hypothetical protein